MITLSPSRERPYRILCIGSHPDDIEIGCGGTILKLIEDYEGSVIARWVVLSAAKERAREGKSSAAAFLNGAAEKVVFIENFEDSFFPYSGGEIKRYMHQLSREFSPDLIFTHYGQDLHQDHRLVAELTWNAFRDHWILEYEIPKYDGDLGAPNVFVPLNEAICRRKITYLLDNFKSQAGKKWFTGDTFAALHRLRGVECNSISGYAEGFHCRKIVLM